MTRPRLNSEQVNLRLTAELKSRLDKRCEDLGIARNSAILLAITS